jgi:hypothetical protein
VVFDITLEQAKRLLPPPSPIHWPTGCVATPCPAGHLFESFAASGLQNLICVGVALRIDPRSEPITVDGIRSRHSGVTVLFRVVQ